MFACESVERHEVAALIMVQPTSSKRSLKDARAVTIMTAQYGFDDDAGDQARVS
jgi:hypothetical protein